MKSKINQKEKQKRSDERMIKTLAYFTFFYFGIRILLSIYLYTLPGFRGALGIVNMIFSPLIMIFAIVCGYYLLKKKLWALVALIVIVAYQIVIMIYQSNLLGSSGLPLVQIAYLIFLISGIRNLLRLRGREK